MDAKEHFYSDELGIVGKWKRRLQGSELSWDSFCSPVVISNSDELVQF